MSGNVEPPEGVWRDFVRKLPGIPKVEIVDSDSEGALEAILRYHVIGHSVNESWLEICAGNRSHASDPSTSRFPRASCLGRLCSTAHSLLSECRPKTSAKGRSLCTRGRLRFDIQALKSHAL